MSLNMNRTIFEDLAKALNNGVTGQELMKAITVATGLTAIDLEPPPKPWFRRSPRCVTWCRACAIRVAAHKLSSRLF